MIVYLQGNILNTPAVTIVNTVNTVGVMGKGIALSLKNRYPEMFDKYLDACQKKELHVGKLMYYKAVDHDVLLFPTKAHWKYPSRLKWIEDGLKTFCEEYVSFGIQSIAFPMLGCGNGGLTWVEVKPLMEQYLSDLPIQVFIYTGAGPVPVWGEKPIRDYRGWLNAIALDFDADMVLQRFSEYLMLPYEFVINGEKVQMLYMPGELCFMAGSETVRIPEDEFRTQWDKWRNVGVFMSEDPEMTLLLVMLKSMSYLEPVLVEQENELIKGYQMLLMRDRAYNSLNREMV